MAWRELSASLRSSCSDTCPDMSARKSQPTLAGEKKSLLCIYPAILLTIRKRRLLSLIAICTIPNFRCSSSFEMCVFFGTLSQFLFVIASSRRGRSVLACFHGENVFLCEASSLSCESTEAREERNLYSCLEFVALEFEVHQRFTEIT